MKTNSVGMASVPPGGVTPAESAMAGAHCFPLCRAFGTVARLKERTVPVPAEPPIFLPDCFPVGPRSDRVRSTCRVAEQAPQTLGKHQTHIRSFYAFAEYRTCRPARPSPRAETSHKNHLCSFGGGGSNTAFLACGAHEKGVKKGVRPPKSSF